MITKEKTPPFDLEGYLTDGVEAIVKDALRATLKDPRESAFMARYALASKTAAKRRAQAAGECAAWESWNLSAYLASRGGTE